MTTINTRPGHAWENEDIILVSKAGVKHYPHPGELSPFHVEVTQQYSPQAFYIVDQGDYLSVQSFRVQSNCYKKDGHTIYINPTCEVGEWKSYISRFGRGPALSALASADLYYMRDNPPQDIELRLYKNLTYALVYHVMDAKDDEHYFVCKANINEKFSRYNNWGDSVSSSEAKSLLALGFTEVFTDEEVKASATRVVKKRFSALLNMLPLENDIRTRKITDRYGSYDFSAETQAIVNAFFQPDDNITKDIRGQMDKTTKWSGIDKDNPLRNLECILAYYACANSNTKSVKTVQKKVDDIAKEFKTDVDKLTLTLGDSAVAVWKRIGDVVACMFKYRQSYRWTRIEAGTDLTQPANESDTHSYIFSYNIKTKTKTLARREDAKWKSLIPNISNIIDLPLGTYNGIITTPGKYYWSAKSPAEIQPYKFTTIIEDGINLAELFAGTNVAWVLDNIPGTTMLPNLSVKGETQFENIVSPLQDQINADNLGSMALYILATSGVPGAEQLLKSGMMNLYFSFLMHLTERDKKNSRIFRDKNSNGKKYTYWSPKIMYDSKGSNLKKMFGLTLDQLRCMDGFLADEIAKETRSDGIKRVLVKHLPTIAGADEFLGCPLYSLSLDLFKEVLSASKKLDEYGEYREWGNLLRTPEVKEAFEHCSPKVRLQHYAEYHSGGVDGVKYQKDWMFFCDYLSMRKQLQEVQARYPTRTIFSESKYPVFPRNSIKFIKKDATEEDSDFITSIDGLYSGLKRVYIHSIRGKLLGAKVHCDPARTAAVLHDELAYWNRFYQDGSKAGAFAEAVKRVKSLEFMDGETGLQLVAPITIEDIQREGLILDHCVGSYVDAIIEGRENIMFIRRQDMLGIPFFTLDVSDDGEIREVHGFRNCEPTEEGQKQAYKEITDPVNKKPYGYPQDIMKFLKNWTKKFKGKLQGHSIKATYENYTEAKRA